MAWESMRKGTQGAEVPSLCEQSLGGVNLNKRENTHNKTSMINIQAKKKNLLLVLHTEDSPGKACLYGGKSVVVVFLFVFLSFVPN